jgi:hypothetical protein
MHRCEHVIQELPLNESSCYFMAFLQFLAISWQTNYEAQISWQSGNFLASGRPAQYAARINFLQSTLAE